MNEKQTLQSDLAKMNEYLKGLDFGNIEKEGMDEIPWDKKGNTMDVSSKTDSKRKGVM